jgi:hypothetical protein
VCIQTILPASSRVKATRDGRNTTAGDSKMKTTNDSLRTPRTLEIEHLYLDATTCTRCRETGRNLDVAIETLGPPLTAKGIVLSLRSVLVESAEQAVRERFYASPTVRLHGQDIVELEETDCEACTDLCGCEEGTSCRVWHYRGEKHQAAPVGLLVEAITAAAFAAGEPASPPRAEGAFELPENLRRFFAGKKDIGRDEQAIDADCCDAAQCDCGGSCDCDELESAGCGCDS